MRSRLIAWLQWLDGAAAVPSPTAGDWRSLVAEAEARGVASALAFAVARGAGAPPPDVARRLATAFADSAARHLTLARALGTVLAAFTKAGIALLPLKGPVLAEMLYRHPALRPCGDLDLLVAEARRYDADRVLTRLGYRPTPVDRHGWRFDMEHDGALAYDGPGGVRVDLHWRLVTDPRFAWNEPASRDVWTRVQPVRFGQIETLALAREDLLVYLACHLAAHHGFGGLVWQWDVARVVGGALGRLDWDLVVDRANAWHVRRALYFALLAVARTFAIDAPADVMARLRPRGVRGTALSIVLAAASEPQRQRLTDVIALLAVDRGAAAAAALRRAVWPSAAWLTARYPAASSPAARQLAHARRVASAALSTAGALLPRRAHR